MLTVVGAAMLWVGWFGFNAGSELAADGVAGMAMAVTQIATATAALGWMFAEWVTHGKPSGLGHRLGRRGGLGCDHPGIRRGWPDGRFGHWRDGGVLCFAAAGSFKTRAWVRRLL